MKILWNVLQTGELNILGYREGLRAWIPRTGWVECPKVSPTGGEGRLIPMLSHVPVTRLKAWIKKRVATLPDGVVFVIMEDPRLWGKPNSWRSRRLGAKVTVPEPSSYEDMLYVSLAYFPHHPEWAMDAPCSVHPKITFTEV